MAVVERGKEVVSESGDAALVFPLTVSRFPR